ncbi:hypothetical protein Tco_1420806 [Tanacetum coccineum]
MSQPSEQTPTRANSAVRNTLGMGSKQTPGSDPGHLPVDKLWEIYDNYITCSIERQRQIEREWDKADRADRRRPVHTKGTHYTEDEDDQGGHWKSRSKKQRSTDEKDLSQPWLCEETDPFTPRIRNFEVPKRTRMPTNVKTYDGTSDPEDHPKIFQTTAKIERWAMPTWCHMFNSTLIGSTRVWFDKLPLESIDSYEVLQKAFLGNFSQQKNISKTLWKYTTSSKEKGSQRKPS